MITIGQTLAFFAAALSTLLAGYGSAKGVGLAGQTSGGVSTENPEVSSKMMVLQILPGTQGIYGFLIGVIILVNTGALGGELKAVSFYQGLMLVVAVLPVAVVGWLSAINQAKVASAGMLMVGQHPEMSGKAITMTVMVETYAVLALLASFLMVNAVKL
ncbi:MAG: V-type ATP synthase subunit K [Bacillota bacterium]|nr:V-type ATP synthase subunit K [Bacillota bacterium]